MARGSIATIPGFRARAGGLFSKANDLHSEEAVLEAVRRRLRFKMLPALPRNSGAPTQHREAEPSQNPLPAQQVARSKTGKQYTALVGSSSSDSRSAIPIVGATESVANGGLRSTGSVLDIFQSPESC